VEKIKKIFNLYSDWRPWVVFYTSTHQSMTLELYKTNLEHRTKILCGDCFYYSGYLGGVPLKLDINIVERENKERIIVITGNGNELVIKCFRISFETSLDI
jgi:hypothetical protein